MVNQIHLLLERSLPKRGVAAVLVLLHLVPETSALTVTLTTRSQRLRSHPGELIISLLNNHQFLTSFYISCYMKY